MTTPRKVAYYAVPDPDDPGRMTYWYRNRRGQLKPHPAKAKYGPRCTRAAMEQAGLDFRNRDDVRAWYETVGWPWARAVREAVEADPFTAGLRFARFCTRCCFCGRLLVEPSSKTYGIGPECRQGLPAATLARLNEALGRVHAATRPQLGLLGGGAVDLDDQGGAA